MNRQVDLGGFAPASEAHAIVSCTVTVGFVQFANDEQWMRVRRAVLEAGRAMKLGIPQPFYGMNVNFDPTRVSVGLNAPSVNIDQILGLSFTVLDDQDHVVERYVVARDSISVQTRAYARWDPFKARLEDFLNIVLVAYVDTHVPYGFTKVEYWDRFERRIENVGPDVSKVISTDSEWIAPGFLEKDGYWHFYAGKFEKVDDRVRRLINVRVDVNDSPSRDGTVRRAITIYTMTQDSVNQPGFTQADPMSYSAREVLASASTQHNRLKRLIGDILTRSARETIGLEL